LTPSTTKNPKPKNRTPILPSLLLIAILRDLIFYECQLDCHMTQNIECALDVICFNNLRRKMRLPQAL
jgi:hypothetical protein